MSEFGIFKFVTLPSGMEKYHLVPVINKLLKLSPEEQKQIETVAKGKNKLQYILIFHKNIFF